MTTRKITAPRWALQLSGNGNALLKLNLLIHYIMTSKHETKWTGIYVLVYMDHQTKGKCMMVYKTIKLYNPITKTIIIQVHKISTHKMLVFLFWKKSLAGYSSIKYASLSKCHFINILKLYSQITLKKICCSFTM